VICSHLGAVVSRGLSYPSRNFRLSPGTNLGRNSDLIFASGCVGKDCSRVGGRAPRGSIQARMQNPVPLREDEMVRLYGDVIVSVFVLIALVRVGPYRAQSAVAASATADCAADPRLPARVPTGYLFLPGKWENAALPHIACLPILCRRGLTSEGLLLVTLPSNP
jgi:hypothetical protein